MWCQWCGGMKTFVSIGIGCLLSTLGALLAIYWPDLLSRTLQDEMVISAKSKHFHMWEVTPIPMYIEFYFFNWTNHEDFLNTEDTGGIKSKPNLVELGPYVFREFKRKVIDGWHPNNNTVTFRQNRTWVFESERSNGSLDDLVTTINIPAISAAFTGRHLSSFMKIVLDQTMKLLGTNYYVKKKVGEFLFDGYEDPLLDLASIVPSSLVSLTMPVDRFGWFYKRNGSSDADGIFNMQTGSDNIQNLGKLSRWNYSNQTRMYDSYCGRVNGSAGELYPPGRNRTDISFFSPDICRSLTLKFKEEINLNGIVGYRYWGDEHIFSNQTVCADNWCFCPSGECPPNGALDVSTCKFGSPAFVSFPHFLHADPSYRSAVDGMNPHEEEHQLFIDLEPSTGIPLRVSASFQINVLIQPHEQFSLFSDVPKIYFPVIWFRQAVQIDDDLTFQLKCLLALPTIGIIVSYIFLGVGVIIIVFTIILVVNNKIKGRQDSSDTFSVKFITPLLNSPLNIQSVVLEKLTFYK